MRKFLKENWVLVAILLLAAVLRLWNLGTIPPHLTNDEAALGFNAYSILKNGRDEYGEFLPIIFKSFGDWKPGLYIYTALPSIALFGLNEFATRLPGAISGIIAVWLIYLVAGELFSSVGPAALHPAPTSSTKLRVLERGPLRASPTPQLLATLSAFFLAISPWHIYFSRGAWEMGLALTLTLTGVYFFLRAIRDKPNWVISSAIFFAMTFLAYRGATLATGLVLVGLVLFYFKQILSLPRGKLAIGIITGVLVALPALLTIIGGKAGRLEVYSIFSYPRPEKIVEEILSQGNETKQSASFLLFHSEPLNFARGIFGRWLNHYSARFLFFEGDWASPRQAVPNAGVMLLADSVLLIAGFAMLARMKIIPSSLFLFYWLVVAPLPAALSRDSIQAARALNEVIPLTIIVSAGALLFWQKLKNTKFRNFILGCFILAYVANFIYWLDQYFVHAPVHNAKSIQYGYKQLVERITPIQKDYKQIVFAQSYDQPYIYFLFYQKYDPLRYQKIAKLVTGPAGPLDVGLVENLENISFEWIDWQRDQRRKGILIVGTPEQISPEDLGDPNQFNLVDEIKYPNGQTAFRLIEVL